MRNPQATRCFRTARDVLLRHRTDLQAARQAFTWPDMVRFNWALDWFDVIAQDNDRIALHLIGNTGNTRVSYSGLARRSDQVAGWLREIGVRRRDRILLALPNGLPLWETMLAAIKLGAIVVPTYPTAPPSDLADRIHRADVSHVLTEHGLTDKFAGIPGSWTPICTGPAPAGWLSYDTSLHAPDGPFEPDGPTGADDPLFCYFTSGTTSRPKMVLHTHTSYPVGHLSGMYWNGVQPGDVHVNIAAPGWAKHSWGSFFVPWNAEATLLAFTAPHTPPPAILDALRTHGVNTFCAPPTVWRSLLAEGLGDAPPALREATSAGEPLEASLIEQVAAAWGVWLRDGYGQTETTCQIGNPPGRRPEPGSMGWPMPGYETVVTEPGGNAATPTGEVGELCVDLANRPAGMMSGYLGDGARTAAAFTGGRYHTGDLVTRDASGALRYHGRDDDMFKSFDHRIAPLELEAAILDHPAVAQAAVVPVPDPVGLWIPKAFVVPAPGWPAREDTARLVLQHASTRLPGEKMIKVLQFVEALPVATSGKIQRGRLRTVQAAESEEFRVSA
ncbi:AMP-binding protein [Kitasatospora aureofaciens]|uniref:AMP-binding protein n=1 Tax=Kitasatospora aureofaciens TaxID=1894 RepID=UPI003817AC49